MIQTMKSDEVRNSFRDVLDAVQNGSTVVIERYNKSIGVLVPIDKWHSYERIEAAIVDAYLLCGDDAPYAGKAQPESAH